MTRRRVTVAVTSIAVVLNAALFVLSYDSNDVFWALDRSAGETTIVLTSVALILGVLRAGQPSLNLAFLEGVHADVALVTGVFGAVHVVSTILGLHTSLGPQDAVVPFVAAYRGMWVGLGVISAYVYVAVMLTSGPMRRLPRSSWAWVHRGIYIGWGLALIHAGGAGSDSRNAVYVGLDVVAVASVLVAVLALRLRRRVTPPPLGKRSS